MTSTSSTYHLNLRVAGKAYSLDFRQAFSFGYTLARRRKFTDASQVFEALTHADRSGQLPLIMLAYCKAGLRDYAASKDLLSRAFINGEAAKVDQLHTAFIYRSVGMWADAATELTKVVRECPELPVICLLLGELLASQGRRTKAILCWRLAVARDHEDGAVAAIARHLMPGQAKPHTSP